MCCLCFQHVQLISHETHATFVSQTNHASIFLPCHICALIGSSLASFLPPFPAASGAPADAPKAALFIGNMAWETHADTISEIFSGYDGFIEVSIACHEDTGRSKGWALVTFHHPEQVSAAIAALNHSIIDGRSVYMRHNMDLQDHNPTFNVYIGNLPFRGFREADLDALLERFGPYFHLIQAKSGK